MIYGHKNREVYKTPDWAGKLTNYYWVIRAESYDKSKRRRYYRLVAKEKLRLAELGIEQDLIEAVCNYLVKLTVISGIKMQDLVTNPNKQMRLNLMINRDNLPI